MLCFSAAVFYARCSRPLSSQGGGRYYIEYDEAQNMGYAGGPVRMETSLIRKKRSPDGWRVLSSRKLQHAPGAPVPQDSVHPPAEFWEDGEEVRCKRCAAPASCLRTQLADGLLTASLYAAACAARAGARADR